MRCDSRCCIDSFSCRLYHHGLEVHLKYQCSTEDLSTMLRFPFVLPSIDNHSFKIVVFTAHCVGTWHFLVTTHATQRMLLATERGEAHTKSISAFNTNHCHDLTTPLVLLSDRVVSPVKKRRSVEFDHVKRTTTMQLLCTEYDVGEP